MKIELVHQDIQLPTRGTEHAGGFDIYMPCAGKVIGNEIVSVALGFKTEVPIGYVAMLLPRSSAAKMKVELANTCGVIDADYRGEWLAKIKVKDGGIAEWNVGDRLLQFIIVPVLRPTLEVVESVSKTDRGTGGFGSTGT